LWIAGSAEDLPLSASLAQQLPEPLREVWDKYQPEGRVDVQFNLEFDGRTWQPRIDATLKDVAITWYRLPYPLQHCRGKIHYTTAEFTVEMVGVANSTPVTVRGNVKNPGPQFAGRIDIASDDWIAWEDAMVQALDEPVRRIVTSLAARGQIQVAATLDRQHPGGSPHELQITVHVREGWLNYDRFPYPLQNVSGRISLAEGVWHFENFQGRNGSCQVQAVGSCRPGAAGETNLFFTAADVPLENELRDALPANVHRVWNDLSPRGSVDNLRVHWLYAHPRMQSRLQVVMRESAEPSGRLDATPIHIQPTWLPYRLDQVAGTLSVDNGNWTLSQFSGRHGDTQIHCDAVGTVKADGSWTAGFEHLVVEQMRLNRELLAALPLNLSRPLSLFDDHGQFRIEGKVEANGGGNQRDARWTWDLLAQMDQAGLNFKIPVTNMFGEARLAGVQQGHDFRLHAILDLESVACSQFYLADLRGSVMASPDGITLGSLAGRQLPGVTPTPMTCRAVGGQLEIQAHLLQATNVPFQARFILRDGNLRTVARELALTPQSVDGRVFADIGISGNTDGWHTLQGAGNVRLREANIYQVPQMLALLKLLEAKTPDRTAFTASDSSFRIRGDRIYFDQLDLYGDAITLKGEGEIDFQRRLDLEFYTIMGRENRWLPAIRPLLGEASRQFLLIRVGGTVEQPEMTREVLPGLNEGLRQFFPEAASLETSGRQGSP
jgi:hypothetical protein